MIKERVREQFIRSCLKEYEEKVLQYNITYDKWMRGTELKIAERFASGEERDAGNAVETFLFSSLKRGEDADLSFMEYCIRADEDTVFLFVSDEGKLTVYAKDLIRDYFVRNPSCEVLYGDEDILLSDGTYDDPYFKPDWSPDLYLKCNYTGSVFAARAGFMKRMFMSGIMSAKVPDGIIDAADELFFRLSVNASAYSVREGNVFPVGHIDEILFHRDEGSDLFRGRGLDSAELTVDFGKPRDEFVSVIIPSKDNVQMLMNCVNSVRRTCDAAPAYTYEIIVVDNGSTEDNRDSIAAFLKEQTPSGNFSGAGYLYAPAPFNFASMCNMGASAAKGNVFLFLNDDVRAVDKGWLETMLRYAGRPYAGAVGAKLLYPDSGTASNLIQHCGIANVRVGPVHKLQRLSDDEEHYFGYNRGVRDCIGVTGACMMIKKDLFYKAGAFKEQLAVAFNDVELCYSLYEAGFYNICVNDIHLIHHESFSRGDDTEDLAKVRRLDEEYRLMMERHPFMYNHDPFYHKYLTDNENIAGNARQTDIISAKGMEYAAPRRRFLRRTKRCREDEVVRVGVEYAGTVKGYEMEDDFRVDETALGYYIRGYSFVIGADNANYERHVLLQPLKETGDKAEAVNRYYALSAADVFRPDIEARIANQTHVALTGYHTRMKKDALPPGRYRVGILATDIVTGVKLFNFGSNLLTIR